MPKKIIYNLVEFTKAMVDFISDGSQEGQIRLIDVFKQAQTKYSAAESSYLVQLITYFSRNRAGDFDKTISDLQAFPDPMIRLQEFKKFVSEGEWKSTSANTLVLTSLIRAISGYENSEQALSDQYIHQVLIPHLKELINKDIDALLNQHRIAAEQAEARKRELLAMLAGQRKTAEAILLFDNDLEAGKSIARHPEKQVFCLLPPGDKRTKWQLSWYDLTGKANVLVIKSELERTLESLKPQKLPEENTKQQFKIKLECAKLVEEQLARMPLLIDPSPDKLVNLTSTYVLTRRGTLYKLFWYDSLGNSNSVPLLDFPLLAKWLAEKKQILEEDVPRLKTYLQHIRFRKEIDEVKQTNVGKTLSSNHGITLVGHNDLAKIPRFRLIAGTYFLTREPNANTGAWTLYQKQKGEPNLQKINTDSWEAFHEILAKNNSLSAEQLASTIAEPYELCLRPKDFMLEKAERNKLYMSIIKVSLGEEPKADSSEPSTTLSEDVLQFSVMNTSGKLITQTINKKELKHEILNPLTEEQLRDLQADILAIVAKRGHILSIADLVRGSIKSTDNSNTKRELYRGIDAFAPNPDEVTSYKPGSFIATKKEKQWQLYYIDTLQKAVKVDISTQKGLTELFAGWVEEPGALNQSQLNGLAKVLGGFQPAERLNMHKFSALAQLIGQSHKPKVKDESRAATPGKLNLNNFAIARGFGHKSRDETSKKSEDMQQDGVNLHF